jgi:hypothetical protein
MLARHAFKHTHNTRNCFDLDSMQDDESITVTLVDESGGFGERGLDYASLKLNARVIACTLGDDTVPLFRAAGRCTTTLFLNALGGVDMGFHVSVSGHLDLMCLLSKE